MKGAFELDSKQLAGRRAFASRYSLFGETRTNHGVQCASSSGRCVGPSRLKSTLSNFAVYISCANWNVGICSQSKRI